LSDQYLNANFEFGAIDFSKVCDFSGMEPFKHFGAYAFTLFFFNIYLKSNQF